MPDLSAAPAPQSAKLLLIGHSGSGKSGALASLANEGYELFIVDFDNGLDPLYHFVEPQFRKNVHFHTLQDQLSAVTGETQIVKADAFSRAMRLLADWQEDGKSLGSPLTWGPDKVVVIDSLTFASTSALHLASIRNGQNSFKPKATKGAGDPRQIIGEAQTLIEGMLANLASTLVKCNVVLLSHVTYEGPETDPTGFPSSVGRKLSPVIPRYFNTMLYIEKQGPNRFIRQSFPNIPTKCPVVVPDMLPLSTGLATVVKAITKQPSPKEKSK